MEKELQKLEKKIIGLMGSIKNKQIEPKDSGIGKFFKGVFDLSRSSLNIFKGQSKTTVEEIITFKDINDKKIDEQIGKDFAEQLRHDVDLINGVYDNLDKEKYSKDNMQMNYEVAVLKKIMNEKMNQNIFI